MPHLVLVATLALTLRAFAGPVSVSDAQRQKLAELVKSDPDAGRQFDEIRKIADEASKSEPDPIRSEGKLKNDPEKIATGKSMYDMHKIFALGWAFAVTGDSRSPRSTRSSCACTEPPTSIRRGRWGRMRCGPARITERPRWL